MLNTGLSPGGIGGGTAVPHREVLEEIRQSHIGRYWRRHGSPIQGGIGGDMAVPHREVLKEAQQSHTGRYEGGTAVPHKEVLEEVRQSHSGKIVVPFGRMVEGLDTCVITTRMILH